MSNFLISNVPRLKVSKDIRGPQVFDPKAVSKFYYEAATHREIPHVVKFSGGRSSAMMLFTLLEAGLLKVERGDVIVFNNTSAEHPKTYEFIRKCKDLVESRYKIPFFWVEFQTYEDARGGEWSRLPAYRLVKSEPYSENSPNGYHWRGEVFEELLSWAGFVPNQFQRTCTASLKLETTRAFLKDWFACKAEIEHLGHFGNGSRVDSDEFYKRHRRNNGGVPKDIFLQKKEFVRSQPISRPKQYFSDFSNVFKLFHNKHLINKSFGNKAYFGPGGIEYLAFIGLRYDEMRRVVKVRRRNSNDSETNGYEGEHVYMPLSEMQVTSEDVKNFWNKQSWGLELDADGGLSNCTYCFLKGSNTLKKVFTTLEGERNYNWKGTPCDIKWWVGIEKKYGRDLEAEQRKIRKGVPNNFIGFFGNRADFTYAKLAELNIEKENLSKYETSVLPCDCTD